MFGEWDDGRLKFTAPDSNSQHVILVFEHSQRKKMTFVIRKNCTEEHKTISNCNGDSFKSHDYEVLPASGTEYCIEIRYGNFDCHTDDPLTAVPENDHALGFGRSAGPHIVEQWRFIDSAPMPNPLCGITIIVIDEIVGPDTSRQ